MSIDDLIEELRAGHDDVYLNIEGPGSELMRLAAGAVIEQGDVRYWTDEADPEDFSGQDIAKYIPLGARIGRLDCQLDGFISDFDGQYLRMGVPVDPTEEAAVLTAARELLESLAAAGIAAASLPDGDE